MYLITHAELIRLALNSDPEALTSLPGKLHHIFPDIIRDAVLKRPALLKHTSSLFQISHPEILLEVVNQRGRSLQFVNDGAQVIHPHIVLAALRRSEEAYEYVAETLRSSSSFLVDAVMTNFNVFGYIKNDEINVYLQYLIWKGVQERVARQQLDFPDGMMKSYDDFVTGLAEHGITDYPRRIRSFKTAYQLMQDRHDSR